MTDRRTRRRLVDLSVVAVSALAIAVSYVVVAKVDADRRATRQANAAVERTSTVTRPVQQPSNQSQVWSSASRPPVPGLQPAPRRPVRRVIIRRRSRAS